MEPLISLSLSVFSFFSLSVSLPVSLLSVSLSSSQPTTQLFFCLAMNFIQRSSLLQERCHSSSMLKLFLVGSLVLITLRGHLGNVSRGTSPCNWEIIKYKKTFFFLCRLYTLHVLLPRGRWLGTTKSPTTTHIS